MIAAEFFIRNRHRIIEQTNGGLVCITAFTPLQRSNDASFQFEQEANFWWLTGIDAADWWVIIDGQRNRSWLVRPHISASKQIFDGSLSVEDAIHRSGIDVVIDEDEALRVLHEATRKHSVVYTIGDSPYASYSDFYFNPAPKKLWQKLSRIFPDVQDIQRDIAKLRAIKQPEEITALKKAIRVTNQAFEVVHSKLDSFHYEYEIEAEFSYLFRRAGARGHAYDPIVASGGHACTLHYDANEDRLHKHQLVLLDIGARVDSYAADITRTYQYGEATKRQRQVHQVVQQAQRDIIAFLGPGKDVMEYQREVDGRMKQALIELDLLSNPADETTYRTYFPHAISHGLGVDVHDSLGGTHRLEAGMVLTVEPGIYIPEEGIGVRLEDDILITSEGYQNLSGHLSTDL